MRVWPGSGTSWAADTRRGHAPRLGFLALPCWRACDGKDGAPVCPGPALVPARVSLGPCTAPTRARTGPGRQHNQARALGPRKTGPRRRSPGTSVAPGLPPVCGPRAFSTRPELFLHLRLFRSLRSEVQRSLSLRGERNFLDKFSDSTESQESVPSPCFFPSFSF